MVTEINNSNIHNFVNLYLNSKKDLPLDLKTKAIGNWVVTLVTNMEELFKDMHNFNEQLNGWDVSNVSNMKYMSNSSQFIIATETVKKLNTS